MGEEGSSKEKDDSRTEDPGRKYQRIPFCLWGWCGAVSIVKNTKFYARWKKKTEEKERGRGKYERKVSDCSAQRGRKGQGPGAGP